jgi:hypothetical protein
MLALGRGLSRLFRNNCGLAKFPNGSTVKYGVCNPGGSDLIGWTSVVVTPEMVGRNVAVFTAIEVKDVRGRASDPQKNFIKVVREAGGFAGIAKSVAEAFAIINQS